MSKCHKNDVDYSPGMKSTHCGKVFEDDKGYCKFFIGSHKDSEDAKNGRCEKVEGDINPVYWCFLFKKA